MQCWKSKLVLCLPGKQSTKLSYIPDQVVHSIVKKPVSMNLVQGQTTVQAEPDPGLGTQGLALLHAWEPVPAAELEGG